MNIEHAFLAHHAELLNDLVYTSGAFLKQVKIQRVPDSIVLGLVWTVRYEQEDLGKTFPFFVDAINPSGKRIRICQMIASVSQNNEANGQVYESANAMNLMVRFYATGLHQIEILPNGLFCLPVALPLKVDLMSPDSRKIGTKMGWPGSAP